MDSDKLKGYVIDKLNEGVNADEIWEQIIEAGYSKDILRNVFDEWEIRGLILEKEGMPPTPPPAEDEDDEELSEIPKPPKPDGAETDEENFNIEDVPLPDNREEENEPEGFPDLRSYILNTLRMGFSEKVVKEVAVKAGWERSYIDELFAEDERVVNILSGSTKENFQQRFRRRG